MNNTIRLASNQKITPESKRFTYRYILRLAVFTAVTVSLAALFLLASFIHLQVDAFITPQRRSPVGTPADIRPDYQDISLTTRDGLKISGWYLPGSRAEAIILIHGINSNREGVLPEAAILAEAGYHLVLIDLRGHGRSEGTHNTYGYQEAFDVLAAVDYVTARPNVDKVGVLGSSLGGAVVVRAAALDPRVRAVVVESSYSSLPAAVEDAFDDMSIFPKWPFASLLVALAEWRVGLDISQVDSARDLATLHPRPVLIIHGSADHLFPVSHAQRMYEAAQEPKALWIIEGMEHTNPARGHEEAYKTRVLSFFEQAFR